MSNAENICPTLLLEDEPAPSDAFSTDIHLGPHARVASAIRETIYSSDGGKVIGLEGGWGSGKSTVVRLLSQQLKDDPNIAAIPFDAWAHEGDPLRRTYIETVVSALQDAKWVNRENWNTALGALANRIKQTHTRTTRSPTALGILLAGAVTLVPLGSALAAGALRTYSISLQGGPIAWQFLIGCALSLSPLLVATGRLLHLVAKGKTREIFNPASWAFLSGKYDEQASTHSHESPNPTSLEFQKMFFELTAEALAHPSRRILLVIDNLDRTNPDDALKIWSTMQTFLRAANSREQAWFKRVWVLVPYDREGLGSLWGQKKESQRHQRLNLDLVQQEQDDSGAQDAVADSFIEKSFQVRFQVPPLILSGWRSLLSNLLSEALPNHDEERPAICRTLDHFRANRTSAPTPRQLKVFVNQIGAVHRQWAHRYPLDHVAYFVLHSGNMRALVLRLRTGEVPPDDAVRMLGPELQKNLAGLAFNVPPDKGVELLLSGIVYEALTSSESSKESLVDLAKRHGDGFWQTLEQVVFDRLTEASHSALSRSLELVESSQLLDEQRPEAVNVRRILLAAAEKVGKWTPFDKPMGAGVSAALRLAKDPGFSVKIFNAVLSTLAPDSPSGSPTGSGKKIVRGLLEVFRTLAAIGHEDAIPMNVELPVSAGEWEIACEKIFDLDPQKQFWSVLRPAVGFEAIVAFVIDSINKGQFSSRTMKAIEVSSHIKPEVSWEPALAAFRSRLDASQKTTSNEVRWLMDAYGKLKKSGKAQRAYDELFDAGHVLHHFHRATNDGNREARALLASLHLSKHPKNQAIGGPGTIQAGQQFLEAMLASSEADVASDFLDVLKRDSRTDLLFILLEARKKSDPLVIACLRRAADQPQAQSVFTSKIIRERWSFLRSQLGSGAEGSLFAKALRSVLESTNLASELQDADGGFSRSLAPLYNEIIGIEDIPASATLASWCGSKLASLSSDEWVADFAESFELAKLVLLLTSRGIDLGLSLAFVDAIEKHAAHVCRGQQLPPDNLASRWTKLMDSIGEESLRSTLRLKLIRTAADQADGSLHASFFDLYGDYLLDGLHLIPNYEPLFRLFIGMVKKGSPERGLTWAAQALTNNREMRTHKSAEDANGELELRLRTSLNENPTAGVKAMVEALGLGE